MIWSMYSPILNHHLSKYRTEYWQVFSLIAVSEPWGGKLVSSVWAICPSECLKGLNFVIIHRSQSVGHRRCRTLVLGHITALVLLLVRYQYTRLSVCPSHPHWESHTSTPHLPLLTTHSRGLVPHSRTQDVDWALTVGPCHTAPLALLPPGSFLLGNKHVFPDQKGHAIWKKDQFRWCKGRMNKLKHGQDLD